MRTFRSESVLRSTLILEESLAVVTDVRSRDLRLLVADARADILVDTGVRGWLDVVLAQASSISSSESASSCFNQQWFQ